LEHQIQETNRRADKIELTVELWRSEFQILNNNFARQLERLEIIQNSVALISDISTRLIRTEERVQVLTDSQDDSHQSLIQYRSVIIGAIATGLISVSGFLVYTSIRSGVVEPIKTERIN
jgi:hypothetical protein